MNNATLNSLSLNNQLSVTTLQPAVAGEIGASVVVSDYKWLTQTLKTAQQQQALRPYYTCQIIDDNMVPVTSNRISTNPKQGNAVQSPDGFILAVGLDASNNVGFWKIINGTNTAQWNAAPNTILENNASNRNSRNTYSIKVSDFINGTYKIDVYFFGNFDAGAGPNLTIKHYYSYDGGTTWASSEPLNSTSVVYDSSLTTFSIAGGKPYLDNQGHIISTCFYSFGDVFNAAPSHIYYQQQQFSGVGIAFGSEVKWSGRDINTNDWSLWYEGLDSELIDGKFHLCFSGFHTFYEAVNQNDNINNFNLYITKIESLSNSQSTDIWGKPVAIATADSSSPQNLNEFLQPNLNLIGDTLFVTFLGETVKDFSLNLSTNTTNVDVYQSSSKDFINFSYPVPLTTGYDMAGIGQNSFFNQGSNFYLLYAVDPTVVLNKTNLIQLHQNNIVADVTDDILNYKIVDNQQGASTIQLVVGNANNKWYAGNPSTGLGYAALAKNNKINIFQGYYNASGLPEVVPKDIFYIDDIQQTVNSNRNDLTITGRNLYKNLKTLSTKFTYSFDGIRKYVDYFNSNTAQNYNFQTGSWSIDLNAGQLVQTDSTAAETFAIFSLYQQQKSNTIFSVCAQLNTSFATIGTAIITMFFYYVDPMNYVRIEVYHSDLVNHTWIISKRVNGTITALQTGTFAFGTHNNIFPFLFVRNSFYKCQIYVGSDINDGEGKSSFNTPTALGTEVDFSGLFTELGSVGLGGILTTQAFDLFRYFEFDQSQNIEELSKNLATKASIFDYKMPTIFKDYLYSNADYTGTFTTPNRILTIPSGNIVTKNDENFDDLEVKFDAKIAPIDTTQNYGFSFKFRDNTTDGLKYLLKFNNQKGDASASYISVRLYLDVSGVEYLLGGSGGFGGVYSNNQLFNINDWHNYRVVFQEYYLFVMIDNIVVFVYWFNTSDANENTGKIGFKALNGIVSIKNIVGVELYSQIDTYSLNPGDDLENSLDNLTSTVLNYYFSDLLGRFKIKQLSSDEASNYTYQDQVVLQSVDNSDKEYVNQVTVNGLNVIATVRDDASISSSGLVRELVVNDNKITTYKDAYNRGRAELISANKYNNQYSPKQVLNVGSEVYDVVTVINTGANSSNVDQDVRIYSQENEVGGNNSDYWLQLDTGTV